MDELDDNESNSITVEVGRNMDKAEVVEEILRQIRQMEKQT